MKLTALIAGGAALAALAQAAQAGPPAPDVPNRVRVPDGHKLFLSAHAEGVQVYECNGQRWDFTGPRAHLYRDGRFLATHDAGPTWEAKDGSAVVGARVDGVTVDGTAIPWLLLSASPTPGSADDGRLSATKFIQRTHTTGGLAPAASTCDAGHAGDRAEVPYTAEYHFWKETGR